jgi:hypothetical protein
MTAEIAVMNKSGIALAADSAVTISYPGSRTNYKIFYTNKLFMLSKYYPIGIMIFGNASLMGIPWEILIKEYRKKELARRNFPTLSEYGADFIKYLNGNTFYFTEELQQESVYQIFTKQRKSIGDLFNKNIYIAASEKKPNEETDVITLFQSVLGDAINKVYEELNGLDNIDTFKITERRFNQKYGQLVDEMINGFQKQLPNGVELDEALRSTLKKIAYLAVVKNTFEINDASGVVIAGFGENEIYPSLIAYDIETIIDNKLKFLTTREKVVTHQQDSFVEPFAQEDMVQTFMRGVSPSYEEIVDGFIQEVLDEYPDAVAAKISEIIKDGSVPDDQKSGIARQCKDIGKEFLKRFREKLDEWVEEKNYLPVERSVSTLPIEELASMASALVNLTSFKRRVTPALETVGGAVDVAVITKGDGFVWIDRKHYFEAGKNPHFFANNYRGERYDKQEKQEQQYQPNKVDKNKRDVKTKS